MFKIKGTKSQALIATGGIKVPKALILTDTNELDTPLTVGHMQGKFKLGVIKGTGHFIMEDDRSAMMKLINFVKCLKYPGMWTILN